MKNYPTITKLLCRFSASINWQKGRRIWGKFSPATSRPCTFRNSGWYWWGILGFVKYVTHTYSNGDSIPMQIRGGSETIKSKSPNWYSRSHEIMDRPVIGWNYREIEFHGREDRGSHSTGTFPPHTVHIIIGLFSKRIITSIQKTYQGGNAKYLFNTSGLRRILETTLL